MTGTNPHKKGEHVFNDIGGSVENAFRSAIGWGRTSSLVVTGMHGPLRAENFPASCAYVAQFVNDEVLVQARTVVAPATGHSDDPNSRRYGEARLRLERELAGMVESTADFLFTKMPRANSSFREFETIVSSVRKVGLAALAAKGAFQDLIDAAYDPAAESGALKEITSDSERARRAAAISTMKRHLPTLKLRGQAMVSTFKDEVEKVLSLRIP